MTAPDFKIIPSENQLAEVSSDLRFHPADPSAARSLTPRQVAGFNRDGCVSGLRVYDDEAILKIWHYFDDLLVRVTAAGGDS